MLTAWLDKVLKDWKTIYLSIYLSKWMKSRIQRQNLVVNARGAQSHLAPNNVQRQCSHTNGLEIEFRPISFQGDSLRKRRKWVPSSSS